MKITVIKYNAGNIYSVMAGLKRLGAQVTLTNDKEVISSSEKVLFPGVGEASTTMAHLKQTGLDEVIKNLKQPVLGICLGMQLMCNDLEEGKSRGLGIFDVDIKKFNSNTIKIPHMGWNNITQVKEPLFTPAQENQYVYFANSYYAPVCADTAAVTDYIQPFSAALRKNNFYAMQFHPEKSGKTGEQILKNFLELK